MRQIPHFVALFSALAVLSVGTAGPAQACSCLPQSLSEAFLESDLIVQGSVTEVTPVVEEGWLSYWTVVLSLEKSWKGEKGVAMVTVLDPPNGAVCGFGFQVGESYVVYALRDEKREAYTTSLCSRTALLRPDLPDITYLDSVVAVEAASWSTIKRLFVDD